MPDEEKLKQGKGAAFQEPSETATQERRDLGALHTEQARVRMGEIGKRLHGKLKRMARATTLPTRSQPGRADMPSIEKFIKDGLDPVHAVYVFIQHLSSHFAELVSRLPEMKSWTKVVGDAEEEYMPSGPPMSPLTRSFFTTWAYYDLKIGGDTLGTCQIAVNDVVMMNPHQLGVLRKLCESRMGIYEHAGMVGPYVRLRELITGDEFVCLSTSGYRGQAGELWYVRLLPPLEPDLGSYWIIFTTPYVLIESSKDDWTQFFKRTLLKASGKGQRERLHDLMKHGLGPRYWSEFVFQAYHHHQHDAIFLAGIPDLKATLPHA